MSPASANDNAAAAVMVEVAGIGVVAALDHPTPSLIGWTAGETMYLQPLTRFFATEAAARLGVAAGEIPDTSFSQRTTIAAQLPDMMLSIGRTEGADRGQSAEAAIRNVQRTSHV